MDKFVAKMQEECSVGGIHCSCCNPYKPSRNGVKHKKKLTRIASRRLKHDDMLERERELEEKVKSELGVDHVTLG
jgi:hypothetical protein